jgi:AcrR family transcriptional regulator
VTKADEASPRQRLNRDRVLDAGIALADAEGIDALSMRKLAQRLGVEAMSLYNHVRNKDDLLDGMLDRVAGEIELPDDGQHWRAAARSRAISAHGTLMRHPWAAQLWVSAAAKVGPQRMRYLDHALQALRSAGFAQGLLDRAFHTIENHIMGHALQTLGFALDPEQMNSAGREILRTFPADDYPDLAAHIRYHVDNPGGDDEFEFGLDLILDGLVRAGAGA